MSDFRDRFERQLVEAAQRHAPEADERTTPRVPHRGRQPWRAGLAAGLAIVASGAAFLMALSSSPNPDGGGSSASGVTARNAPPTSQLMSLGVLRRPPRATDRGPEAAAAVAYPGGRVRKGFVRRLPAPKGIWAFLVSLREYRSTGAIPSASRATGAAGFRDALCLEVSRFPREGYTDFCFRTTELRRGTAVGYWGRRRLGVVPDGVARVAVHRTDGRVDRVRVVDNFYTYGPPQGDGRSRAGVWVQWLDADGRPIAKGQ